jgi:calcineurin-like phosphoesterase family protein
MNFEMSSKWNSVVKNDDVVIHLGDVSAGLGGREDQLKELISSLKGRKFLIRGNHDHQTDKWYEDAGFEKVFDHVRLGGVLLLHYSLFTALERGVNLDEIGEIEHVVHGHTHHASTPNHENHFNVAVDRNDFFPVDYRKAIPDHLQTQFIDAVSCLL